MTLITYPSGLTAVQLEAASKQVAPRPPILCLHGMMAGAWQFERFQILVAARGYTSVALNLRGHRGSGSVRDIGRVSMQDYIDDAISVARTLDRPIVIGQSMGGLLAQKVAEQLPLSALVLVCSLPPQGIRWQRTPRPVIEGWRHAGEMLLWQAIKPDRQELDDLIFNCIPESERQHWFSLQIPESGRATRAIVLGQVKVDARRITCPVLHLIAEEDRLVTSQVGHALARKIPGSIRPFVERGHYMLVAEPGWEETADSIIDWFPPDWP
jgi:pimeloyl-ACP methyl ester carboxylesterase